MDKRLLIVLPLCLVIVIGWNLFMLKVRPPPPRPQPDAPAQGAAGQTPAAANPAAPVAQTEPAAAPLGEVLRAEKEELRTLRIGKPGEKGSYELDFSNRGGALVELHLGDYFDKAALSAAERADSRHWTRLVAQVETAQGQTRSFLLGTSASSRELAPAGLEDELWTMRVLGDEAQPTGVEFKLAPGTGVVFTKRFTFLPGRHELGFELEIENSARESGESRKAFVLTPIACMPAESADQYYVEPVAVACAPKADGGAEVLTTPRDDSGSKPQGAFALARPPLFAGMQNKYFATLLRGADENARATFTGASWRLVRDEAFARAHPAEATHAWKQVVTELQLELSLPAKGQKKSWSYLLYAGPKERAQLAAAFPEHALLTKHDLGFFDGIASVLLWVLSFFERISGNWGVAIILLTIAVRGILFPINRRSQVAMGRYSTKMKRLQPRIEELKKRYANDRGKLAQEQQKLLQQEGAFPPLGGCLPMFLQIPVFFGLFAALRVAFDLRQARFLWIPDLSLPDHTLFLGGPEVPILGSLAYLNILPPLMIGMWIWQQRGMPVPADEQAAKMQKMMMWMPIVMGVFLYNYAAGLSLYMITQSGLGVFEQKFIKKHWPPDSTEQTPKGPGMIGKMMARAQAAQVEAERLKRQRDSRRR